MTVRDLSEEDVARLPGSVAEVRRIGVVNYFDSQRFGSLKHGQGFLVKDLMRGDAEMALKNYLGAAERARPQPGRPGEGVLARPLGRVGAEESAPRC